MSWQKLQVAPHDLARIAGYGSTAWQSGDGLRAVTYALILLLIGGGVEWLYWCYAGRARRAIAEAAMAGSDHAVPAPRGAVALSARRAVLEACGCVLFAVSIVAASLAFTWPTGLQETVVGIALLVAATRLTAIAVRVLLAPDCPRLRLRCDGVAGSAYRRRLGRNCGRRIVIAQSMRWALSGARTRLHCEPRCRAGDLRVRAGRNPVVVCRAQHHRAPPGRASCVDRAAISSDCRGGRRRLRPVPRRPLRWIEIASGTESLRTPRWRELDSNHRFPEAYDAFGASAYDPPEGEIRLRLVSARASLPANFSDLDRVCSQSTLSGISKNCRTWRPSQRHRPQTATQHLERLIEGARQVGH